MYERMKRTGRWMRGMGFAFAALAILSAFLLSRAGHLDLIIPALIVGLVPVLPYFGIAELLEGLASVQADVEDLHDEPVGS